MYGRIYQRGYYVTCGKCGKHGAPYGGLADQPTLPDRILIRDMRDQGWSTSKQHGLVCPDCKDKRAK